MAAETFLERIVAATRADLAERMARLPLAELRARAAVAPAPRDFAAALRPDLFPSAARLIGEVKRASPSRGVLAERFDPVAQARAYARGGAAAISVLTEPHFFLGALEHLAAVREAVRVPVLRKDFILAPYQVYEARAAGADAVLLLCALLDDARLAELLALTRSLGMEALVEAHDEAEARHAVACGAAVVGVNSRDLRTFAVDTDVVRHLRPLVPMDRVFIAESGIFDATGAARARAWGADAILVGEALMKAADPAATAHELATAPGGASAELFRHAVAGPFVKLCGLTTTAQAALAAELGAEAVGLIFYPPSHRYVSREQARAIAAVASSAGILAAGVFVNAAIDEVIAMRDDVGLSAIQLGGDETPAYCAELAARVSCPLIKSLRLRDDADLDRLDAYALAGATLLLDAHVPGMYGGSGALGNWELACRAAARWPVILSGGLTPANVAPAIAAVGPRGVDVSSGIETAKVKDPAKMRAFVGAAHTASATTVPTEASV